MWWPPTRLTNHTIAALILFGTLLVSPVLLLFRKQLGEPAEVIALALLAVGVSTFSAAALVRLLLHSDSPKFQRWFVLLAGFVLNPVNVAIFGAASSETLMRLSCLPLGAALVLALGRAPLCQGEAQAVAEACSLNTVTNWICSRAAILGMPLLLLSVQVGLYVPQSVLGDLGASAGLFVGGGCMLMSAKFCVMCAVLTPEDGRQRLGLAAALATMLSADGIGAFQMIQPKAIPDDKKEFLLALHFLLIGVVLFRTSWSRLRLRDRWRCALAERSARQVRLAAPDLELNSDLAASFGCPPGGAGESSDSDDELGPGSLPQAFHDALLCLLLAAVHLPPREFLLAPRVVQAPPPKQPGLPQAHPQPPASATPSETHGGAAVAPQDAEVAPIAMPRVADKRCTICLRDIEDGEVVRPLPKCSHVFHVACLDSWALQQREKTDCPNCRRPALARKALEGSVSYKDLTPEPSVAPGSTGRRSSSTSSGSPGASVEGRPRSEGRPRVSPQSAQALASFVGVSQELAAAALQARGGEADEAANLLFTWSALVSRLPDRSADAGALPEGLLQGVVEAFPALEERQGGVAAFLLRCQWARRMQRPWSELAPEQRQAALRAMLEPSPRA